MAAEARKAYAAFMNGTDSSNNAQQHAQQPQPQPQPQGQWQQPGSNLQNQYAAYATQMQQGQQDLQNSYAGQPYPQVSPFARVTVPPAAPTPPPAVPQAPSSSAALSQHGQLQPYVPQGPPGPAPPHARHQGYAGLPRNYNPSPQFPPSNYYPEWQHNRYGEPAAPQSHLGHSYSIAPTMASEQGGSTHKPRDWSYESTRDHNRVRFNGVWPPPDVVRIPSPPKGVGPPPDAPPLAVCHVCSVCGQMRSAGYHRHHPIIPGQAHINTPCRRCKKRAKKEMKEKEKEKEKEKAKRDEEKESSRTIIIEVRNGDDRGRTRERERERDDSPRRLVYRSISRYRPSTREASPERSPDRSPPPVLRRRTRSEVRFFSPSPTGEGVRTYYRRQEEYERPRSPSPNAKARLASHPSAFRTFTPVFQPPGSFPRSPSPAPPRGILKSPSEFFEYPTRHPMDTSYDSMEPEVGSNRVQFVRDSRPAEHSRECHARCISCKGDECTCDDDYVYRHRSRQHYPRGRVEEIPSPEPPVHVYEKLVVRDDSPSPRPSPPRQYIRDQSHPRRRQGDEETIQYVNRVEDWRRRAPVSLPSTSENRGRTRESRSEAREPSPLRKATRNLKDIGEKVRRAFSRSPSPKPNHKHEDSDDATDTGSEASVERYVYRYKYRGLDEDGRPVTWVEETYRKPAAAPAPAPSGERIHVPPGPPYRGFAGSPAISRGFAPGYKD
ncbi:hypothetical protein BU23DRAFT_78829 [Bimuria novae-zelandiae CBS 107.79]|uniref:Uncharacterized protein n=1 Tax=Bimuria novae-zelandiae CBS 107.79 TaxID=1447943 RepID=A0A6A5VDB3_9PLEO|nr:hypothetical protein BU23DRAFT_78829 [Bimuria novae-zelandiae CBS 107.79]